MIAEDMGRHFRVKHAFYNCPVLINFALFLNKKRVGK